MTTVQIVKGNFSITAPEWPRYEIRQVITSDSFDRTGPLVGSMTDTAHGGNPYEWKPNTWSRNSPDWEMVDGQLVSRTGGLSVTPFLTGLPLDYTVGLTVGMPIASRLLVVLRQQEGKAERIEIAIFSGSIRIEQNFGGTTTYLATGSAQVGVGDRVDIGLSGSIVTVKVNGREVVRGETQQVVPGNFFLREHGENTQNAVDDLVIYL